MSAHDHPAPPGFIPWNDYRRYPEEEMILRSREFEAEMKRRRSVRAFSSEPVPRDVVEHCIRAAGTAPNGANHQPWHFVLVGAPDLKRRIRMAAEKEEREFYGERAPQEWLDSLEPLGTDASKPFLEHAPYLIAVFAESFGLRPDGSRRKNYYVSESVGLAAGILITGLHHAGLATLTHTPSPMRFLNGILSRPDRERPFLLVVVGYPEKGVHVPASAARKKTFPEICTILDG